MVYIDNDTKLKVKVKLPILKYNVICGEYKNLKNAIAFSNRL
jgi:delta-aminolevulinic acid dehydratase/porphobilinogen synthase